GKIVLHNLKLKAERIFTHKKLHLTSLSVQLLGCSSMTVGFFIFSAQDLVVPGRNETVLI
ncbi:hypothetical protein, partial [Escherichia coli]|uniref:hypothetical protein n=1 Tax=Escherichia coli TaxID=562 RepID=UPI001BCA3953